MPLKKGMKSLPSLDDFEEDYDSSDEYDSQEIYEDEYEEDDYEEVHEDYEELDDNDFEDETYEEEYEEQHEVHEDYDYSNSIKKKKGNKIILGLVIGGVLAILTSILVFVLFVTSNQNKEQPNNETSSSVSVHVESSESISQNSEMENTEEKNTNENNEQNEPSSESVASSSSEEQSVVTSEESKPEEQTEKDESITIDFVNNETDTIVLNVKTEKSMNINVQYSYIESNDNFVLCESGFQELEKGEREMALECLNNTENVQETQSKSPQTKIIKFKENS